MLAQPESSREREKVVLDGFNKKLSIKVEAFDKSHPGVVYPLHCNFPFSDNFFD